MRKDDEAVPIRKKRILFLFEKPISADEFRQYKGDPYEGRPLRVPNQKIPIVHSGQPTELFGSPDDSSPSKSWIWEE